LRGVGSRESIVRWHFLLTFMKHKKQHYIPQSYLAAWVDPCTPAGYEPYVWIINKRSLQISNRAPKNILFEIDLYTTETEDGERDLSLEHGLSKIEGEFVRIRDSVIADNLPIDDADRTILVAFTAALHSRTPASSERWKPFWQQMLDKMDAMQSWASTASPEDIEKLASHMPINAEKSHIVTREEIQEIVDSPIPSLLAPSVLAEAKQLDRLDLVIFRTHTSPGFVTSDNPVVWGDPEGHKRAPPHQGPALIYPSIEISMPISPTHSLMLNRQGTVGYLDLGEYGPKIDLEVVQGANWRDQSAAQDSLIVNREMIKWDWFY